MSDSVRPHRRQPTRLPRPWDSPGKNTGVGCHFLLQCMRVKSESEVTQSCPTPRDPMDCSLPGSSIHGIFQARAPEWVAIAFSHPYITTGKTTALSIECVIKLLDFLFILLRNGVLISIVFISCNALVQFYCLFAWFLIHCLDCLENPMDGGA